MSARISLNMCGIAGLIGVHSDSRELGQRLLRALRHRGPDDEGVECPHPSAVLVHSRLAIVDLSAAGHQPMSDHPPEGAERNWVVFNGQIFNFLDLAPELARLGWPSRSRSDTEVILNAYRAWGEDCVQRFHGMFAFCLVDSKRRVAHLCRDRAGIKPLYLYEPPAGGLVFSSEVRALLALGPGLVPPRVNRNALESYFAQGAVQGYDTIVSGIGILEPGIWLTVDLATGAKLRKKQYWDLASSQAPKYRDRNEAVERLSLLLRRTVRQQLISDVPLGLFLSGGVDSAALLTVAAESTGNPLRAISIGFDVEEFDETAAAAVTASAFPCNHSIVHLSGAELLAAFPAVLQSTDQPTVDGTNTYVVSRVARQQGLTVALSGLGADELFGGYASFHDVPQALRMRQWFGWTGALMPSFLRRNRSGAKLIEMLGRPPDLLQMYLLRRELFLSGERRTLHDLPQGSDPASGAPVSMLENMHAAARGLDGFDATSVFEQQIYMRHMLLRDADAFSMAAPIECRVPFLDHELMEAVLRVPSSWKRNNGRPKPLLLDAVGPKLPAQVWQRPKRGFAFPWRNWLQPPSGPLSQLALDAVNDQATWRDIGVNPAGVLDLWSRFARDDRSLSPLQILAVLVLRDYVVRHKLRAA